MWIMAVGRWLNYVGFPCARFGRNLQWVTARAGLPVRLQQILSRANLRQLWSQSIHAMFMLDTFAR
jgi:hypothetical protein